MNINDIIIKPYITEKASGQIGNNVYTLIVAKSATKEDIKRAVEIIFAKSQAKVSKIRTQNVQKKPKKLGRFEGYTSSYKKAIVYLAAGSIPVYGATEGVENIEETRKKKGLKIINTEKIMAEAEKKAE